jgi:hypothetical protein
MKKIAAWVLLCALIPAACSDSITGGAANESVDDVTDGAAGIIRREDGGALEDVNVIYRDGEPFQLTLTVGEEWEDVAWYINNPEKPADSGRTLTIDARALSPAEYQVMFTGSLGGFPYSETVVVVVKSDVTEDVIWTDTGKNSSQTEFDLTAWEGAGESLEKWKLLAPEMSRVYFAVQKRPFQTITVAGEHEDKVSMANIGELVDGLRASTNLSVFTVDTGDVDTVFGGGERRFTLMVEEEGKEFKMVQVELDVRPYLTGAAIFAVNGGALERITAENVAAYSNDLYRTHLETGFPAWGIKIDDVTGLAGAFTWLDSYAASGESADNLKEYLIRVEKNETLNRTALTGYSGVRPGIDLVKVVKNVKIRLRGYGAERRIAHNSLEETPSYNSYPKGDLHISNRSLISIGAFEDIWGVMDYNITLQLEQNITIDGVGLTKGNNSPNFANVVYAANSCAFVMKAGSKLTGANGLTQPVYVGYGTATFEMDGGEISGCKKNDYVIYIHTNNTGGKFIYRGGVFFNNDSNKVFDKGASKWYDDISFMPAE